ncbi:MAG: hypothetical protein KDC42_11175 [Ignavibacteriae bacterium]|nr:hypothetical protein [Ignavibacteriota bacterium]
MYRFIFLILFFAAFIPDTKAQVVKVVAEEWNIYNDSLGKFESQGDELVFVEFDREKMQIRVSHGEYITRSYMVLSIEDEEVDGQTALYWNLYDSDYLRVAFIPEMIMFIDHDGNKAMVLTNLTFLAPE